MARPELVYWLDHWEALGHPVGFSMLGRRLYWFEGAALAYLAYRGAGVRIDLYQCQPARRDPEDRRARPQFLDSGLFDATITSQQQWQQSVYADLGIKCLSHRPETIGQRPTSALRRPDWAGAPTTSTQPSAPTTPASWCDGTPTTRSCCAGRQSKRSRTCPNMIRWRRRTSACSRPEGNFGRALGPAATTPHGLPEMSGTKRLHLTITSRSDWRR